MTALRLTAVVAALASVLTAAHAQETNRFNQVPAGGTTQAPPPEALEPRAVTTQSFRPEAQQPSPQPARKKSSRKRDRAVTTGQAPRRGSSMRVPTSARSQYAQARYAERQAVARDVAVVPTEPQRVQLSAGFDQYIARMNIWSLPPWDVPATVGTTVPAWVRVYGMPSEIVAIYPQLAGDQFVVVGDDVVILEPDSRRIVAMLSRTTGSYVAVRPGPPSTTGLAPVAEERVRLSRGQIATIRTVLRQRGCRYERRPGFVIGSLVPATAPLCDFPERVIAAVPDIEGYRFITRRGEVVVVDPGNDRVVSVVR